MQVGQTLVNMGLSECVRAGQQRERNNTGYMCEEGTRTLFNGTFNSTQVLHKAGGIGVEQGRRPAPFTYSMTSYTSKKQKTKKHGHGR